MAAQFKIKGAKEFMRKLNKEIRELKGRTKKGLIEAAIILQRNAEPATPVDLSNLRHSWFIVTDTSVESSTPAFTGEDSGDMKGRHKEITGKAKGLAKELGSDAEPIVIFGYSVNYAPFVHEAIDVSFKRPGAKARWLYAALQTSRAEMLEAIRKHARF